MSGLTDKFNSAAGGGKESEKNEDYLDKGALKTQPASQPASSNTYLSHETFSLLLLLLLCFYSFLCFSPLPLDGNPLTTSYGV